MKYSINDLDAVSLNPLQLSLGQGEQAICLSWIWIKLHKAWNALHSHSYYFMGVQGVK